MIVYDLKVLFVRNDEISAQQRVDIGNKKFLLYCNEDRSMIMGFNSNFCAKVMVEDGTWSAIVDSRELDIFTGFSGKKQDKMIKQMKDGFGKLKAHLKYLYDSDPARSSYKTM